MTKEQIFEKNLQGWYRKNKGKTFEEVPPDVFFDMMEEYANERLKNNSRLENVSNFRFSGIDKGEKFIVNIKAIDRETAIAIFESENPDLKWTTTSSSVVESNLCKCTWPSCRYASNCRNNRQAP